MSQRLLAEREFAAWKAEDAAKPVVEERPAPKPAYPGAPIACPNGNVHQASCKRRTCPFCGIGWGKDNWRRLFVNLGWYGGSLVMVSVTAPGEEGGLPWDEEHCAGRHTRGGAHSGKRGCRVQQRAAREWSDTACERWRRLYDAAARATRRAAPVPVTYLGRVWEPQKRGVPHLHLVLGAATPGELQAAAIFVRELKRLAPEWGFGFVDARGKKSRRDDPRNHGKLVVVAGEIVKLVQAKEAARYLASYLSGRNKHKPGIRETLKDPAMSFVTGRDRRQALPLVYVARKLTNIEKGGTGVTMRSLRRARHLFAAKVKGWCDPPRWATIGKRGPLEEAIQVGVAYQRAYSRDKGPQPPPLTEDEIAEAFVLARYVQQQYEGMPPSWERMQFGEQLIEFGTQLACAIAGITDRAATPGIRHLVAAA